MSLDVSLLNREDEPAWDAFVLAAPRGTFFHLSAWRRIIEQTLNHKTYYLQAARNGTIVGVLPLTHVKGLIFGNSLISNAFCVYGGIVASDEEARKALELECVRLAGDLKVDRVEFRSVQPAQPGWTRKDGLYVTFRKAIVPDVDANMKAIPRKQRAMVRKGISNGLISELDSGVERVHEIYAESVRNLGTPVFSKRFFEALKKEFSAACDVVTVTHLGEPVASVMNFYFRDEVLPYYGGGTAKARDLAANDFMYWEVMRRASERGVRLFDFGRSKVGTGSYNFKRYWGFEPTPLAYEFKPIGRQEIPDINPLNPKFGPLIALWRRMPLSLTKLIGPPIVRLIG